MGFYEHIRRTYIRHLHSFAIISYLTYSFWMGLGNSNYTTHYYRYMNYLFLHESWHLHLVSEKYQLGSLFALRGLNMSNIVNLSVPTDCDTWDLRELRCSALRLQ